MSKLKAVHRVMGSIILIVLIYLSVTGLMMQGIDLSQIMRGEQPVDPDLAGAAPAGGSANILTSADKTASALPTGLDIGAAVQSTVNSGRAVVGTAPLGFVDLRMQDGKVVGTVQTALQTATLDEATGSLVSLKLVPQAQVVTPLDRFRYKIKEYHRMTIFGPAWVLWINLVTGVVLFLMAITGLWLYLTMWASRKKQGNRQFFWVGGEGKQEDWKRAVHRWVGFSAAAFLLVVAFSGVWLGYESLVFGYRMGRTLQLRRAGQGPNGPGGPGANGPSSNAPGSDKDFKPGDQGANGAPPNTTAGNLVASGGQAPNRPTAKAAAPDGKVPGGAGTLSPRDTSQGQKGMRPNSPRGDGQGPNGMSPNGPRGDNEGPKGMGPNGPRGDGQGPKGLGLNGPRGDGQGPNGKVPSGPQVADQGANKQGTNRAASVGPAVVGQNPNRSASINPAPNGAGPTAPGPNGAGQGGPGGPGGPGGGRNSQRLLNDAELPALVSTTWNAAQQAVKGAPIKAIRIRAQGNNPQGVVIAGDGSDTKQLIFNARTGAPVNMNPQGNNGFPWGMEAHQLGKGIHRGSFFGTWARLLDFFAGLALLYLSINGLALYIDYRKEVWTSKKKVASVS